jgi:hypothetical protein
MDYKKVVVRDYTKPTSGAFVDSYIQYRANDEISDAMERAKKMAEIRRKMEEREQAERDRSAAEARGRFQNILEETKRVRDQVYKEKPAPVTPMKVFKPAERDYNAVISRESIIHVQKEEPKEMRSVDVHKQLEDLTQRREGLKAPGLTSDVRPPVRILWPKDSFLPEDRPFEMRPRKVLIPKVTVDVGTKVDEAGTGLMLQPSRRLRRLVK